MAARTLSAWAAFFSVKSGHVQSYAKRPDTGWVRKLREKTGNS